MFDVQKDRAGQAGPDISPFVYRVLLRHLGYAEDFQIAELEISLEDRNELEEFVYRYNSRYAADKPANQWNERGRTGALKFSHASAVLHDMDPATYPAPDSWAKGLSENSFEPTIKEVVDRAFELMARRRPDKALVFIIDEVGQYVADKQERLENLRAFVERLGAVGKNRLRARQTSAQAWLIVTSQERLDRSYFSHGR